MDFIREAARLARQGVEKGEGGPFGAVIVKEGAIVAAAWNRVLARNDPTAHAEMEAIREACRRLGSVHLDGCEIHTTCEPCPMCLAAIHWARIGKVVYALTGADAAAIGFADDEIRDRLLDPRIEMERVACPEAEEVFRVWRDHPNRKGY